MKPPVIALCCILIAAALFYILRPFFQRDSLEALSATVSTCLGERIARETATLLGGPGEVVVLAAGGQFETDADKAQIAGFKKALSRQSGIKIAMVAPPDEKTMGICLNMGTVPEDLFMKAIADHPGAKVIVSFLGLPASLPATAGSAGGKFPRIIALDLGPDDAWSELMQTGIASVVIRMRPNPNSEAAASKSGCADKLDALYVVITPANLKEMQALIPPAPDEPPAPDNPPAENPETAPVDANQ